MRSPPTTEARAAAKVARAANRLNTRQTTRPGSETTALAVGDPVRVNRATPRSGSWGGYDGRNGWVATVNAETFPNGTRYTEVGVCWYRVADWAKASAEAWFRTDELTAR